MEKFEGVIELDAMGGDYGPEVTVPAAISAIKDFGIKVIFLYYLYKIKISIFQAGNIFLKILWKEKFKKLEAGFQPKQT